MELQESLPEPKEGGLLAQWGIITAIASFGTYVLGYLVLRFQLTALGLGTDLDLLDERYLFAGAKFLVYLVAAIPILVLFALPLALLGWVAARSWPGLRAWAARWWARPAIPLTVGLVLSVAMIQLVMRRCFAFDNLLLRDALPEPGWFGAMLTAPDDVLTQLYFVLLLAGIVAGIGLTIALGSWQAAPAALRGLAALVFFFLGIQVLLLPVNYGILLSARDHPRVVPDPEVVPAGSAAAVWLVWEGKTGVTFLVHEPSAVRKLLTVPREKVTRLEIVAYEPLSALRSSRPSDGQPSSSPAPVWTWAKLGNVFVGPSPQAQKALPGRVRGDIFLVDSEGKSASRLTQGGVFHSPLFLPRDEALLALRSDDLVRIELKGGEPQKLGALPGASRLVGIDPKNPNAVFFLADAEGRTSVQRLDWRLMQTSAVTAPAGNEDQSMLSCIRGDERERDDSRLVVKEKDPDTPWTDVFLQRGGKEVNLSSGSEVSNRQPALSHNGRHVAFVRVGNSP
jgi:hypothetical protein